MMRMESRLSAIVFASALSVSMAPTLCSCVMLKQLENQQPDDSQRPRAHLPQVDPASIGPGTVIELDDGVYSEALVLPFQGTAEKPIVIKAAPGARPTFGQSVLVAGAAYLRLEGIEVVGSKTPAFAIREGSHHVTISGCKVDGAALGIWITQGAGVANRIENNTVQNCATHGIAIDRVNARKDEETIIIGNQVSGNGQHGIEVNGSWYIIEGNEVFGNGKSAPGTSGIHVFAKDAKEDAGDHNVIRYNVTYRNRELDGPDGNGIQLDQWCDYNEVYYNIAFENDGAGVNLFDAAHAKVFNNTLYGNCRNPNRNRPYQAELLLAGDSRVDLTNDLVAANNIVVATGTGVSALFVDNLTANNVLSIHHNLLFHANGGSLYSWAGKTGGEIMQLPQTSGNKAHDNIVGDPMFAKSVPAAPADFAPGKESKAIGAGSEPALGGRDLLGTPVSDRRPCDVGAIQKRP